MTEGVIVDGWRFEQRNGGLVAVCPADDNVSVAVAASGNGVSLESRTRYYEDEAYTIPFLVIDMLRRLAT